MQRTPRVSVIIIFLDAARFFREAVESVLAQTYEDWELLLVDDGSADESTEVAQEYSHGNPGKIRYLSHEARANRGMSASRNLGIAQALGEFVAFLDADDVWLPHKLEQQVQLIDSHPTAGLLYGNTLYWYSWAGDARGSDRDFLPKLGVRPGTLFDPPSLLPALLQRQAAVPCTCSVLARRSTVLAVEGFEESFTDLYEDQAFYAKVCLSTPVLVSGECWDKYRQHAGSSGSIGPWTERLRNARAFFLYWLADYLRKQGITSREVWWAVNRECWILGQGRVWSYLPTRSLYLWMRLKRWLVRVEQLLLPAAMHQWLWGNPNRPPRYERRSSGKWP